MSRSHQRVTYVQLDTLRISSIPYELSGRRVHADDWLRNEFSHSLSAFDSDAVRFCLLSYGRSVAIVYEQSIDR